MRRRAIAYALPPRAIRREHAARQSAARRGFALDAGRLLYLASGVASPRGAACAAAPVRAGRRRLPWLAAAIACGGIAGPALLMYGLLRVPGSSASLLLNLEAVFTALIAWIVFRENVDRRIFLAWRRSSRAAWSYPGQLRLRMAWPERCSSPARACAGRWTTISPGEFREAMP